MHCSDNWREGLENNLHFLTVWLLLPLIFSRFFFYYREKCSEFQAPKVKKSFSIFLDISFFFSMRNFSVLWTAVRC